MLQVLGWELSLCNEGNQFAISAKLYHRGHASNRHMKGNCWPLYWPSYTGKIISWGTTLLYVLINIVSKFFFTQREVNAEYHKLLVKFMGYSFEIQYKEGKKNQAADALSRSPLCEIDSMSLMRLNITMSNYSAELDHIKHAITKDPHLLTLVELLSTPEGGKPAYELKNGILLYKNRLVIPAASPLVQKISTFIS